MSDTLLSRMEQMHSSLDNFEGGPTEPLLSEEEINRVTSY